MWHSTLQKLNHWLHWLKVHRRAKHNGGNLSTIVHCILFEKSSLTLNCLVKIQLPIHPIVISFFNLMATMFHSPCSKYRLQWLQCFHFSFIHKIHRTQEELYTPAFLTASRGTTCATKLRGYLLRVCKLYPIKEDALFRKLSRINQAV